MLTKGTDLIRNTKIIYPNWRGIANFKLRLLTLNFKSKLKRLIEHSNEGNKIIDSAIF